MTSAIYSILFHYNDVDTSYAPAKGGISIIHAGVRNFLCPTCPTRAFLSVLSQDCVVKG